MVPMLNEAYESTLEQDTASDRFESSQVLASDMEETLPISPPWQRENAGRWNRKVKRIAEEEIIMSKAIENMARVAECFQRPSVPPVSAQAQPVADADVHFRHFVTAQLKKHPKRGCETQRPAECFECAARRAKGTGCSTSNNDREESHFGTVDLCL